MPTFPPFPPPSSPRTLTLAASSSSRGALVATASSLLAHRLTMFLTMMLLGMAAGRPSGTTCVHGCRPSMTTSSPMLVPEVAGRTSDQWLRLGTASPEPMLLPVFGAWTSSLPLQAGPPSTLLSPMAASPLPQSPLDRGQPLPPSSTRLRPRRWSCLTLTHLT
jgi:hypothetical protein